MNKEKAVVSFSGGKDCTLAMYRMMKSGCEIAALLVTVDNEESCFHKIPKNILNEVSQSLEIPLVEVDCSNGRDYEIEFEKVLIKLKEKGINKCIFGDIDIESHKKWGIDRCNAAGIEAEFPLWHEDREMLVNEFIENKFTAVIKKINLSFLEEEFIGRELTKDLVKEFKNKGIDPCGENGEYHTLVIDGPIFKQKVKIDKTCKEILGQFGYLKIKNI